jgi:DNA-binding transcriptional regulator YdaS (Cro superfamily)
MPETIAGAISGNVTVNMVRSALAPETSAASSSEGSIFRSAAEVNM